jgi:hypothetical protein
MTARSVSAMTVLFSCLRPVVLVSVTLGNGGNIFPMNLMGPIGNGYFAFALNSRRRAALFVARFVRDETWSDSLQFWRRNVGRVPSEAMSAAAR